MSERFSAAQVEALAPDGSSLRGARGLARPTSWPELGATDDPTRTVWGLCKGSGAKPYQTCVDLTEPAYQCSCPSRKFPCKHALALLLLWSAGDVPQRDAADWVRQWHAGRAARTQLSAARAATAKDADPPTPAQLRAASRRAQQRSDRVAAGLAELDQWLADQVRSGIAGLDRAGYRHFDQVAARLVDAQAGGVAAEVRRMATIAGSGEGWPGRLLAEMSLLRLLVNGYRRLDAVPQALAHTIRSRVGFSVSTEDVLSGPRVRDRWQVIGVRDEVDERLTTRRTWLIGADTGRAALVLSFAAPGQMLPADLIVGTTVDAELCFYPGAPPLRALVADRCGSARPLGQPAPVSDIEGVLTSYAAALADNPWLTSWPVLVRGTLLPGRRWRLVDGAGNALPLAAGEPWGLVAAGGGGPIVLAAEWGTAGLRPLAGFPDDEVVIA